MSNEPAHPIYLIEPHARSTAIYPGDEKTGLAEQENMPEHVLLSLEKRFATMLGAEEWGQKETNWLEFKQAFLAESLHIFYPGATFEYRELLVIFRQIDTILKHPSFSDPKSIQFAKGRDQLYDLLHGLIVCPSGMVSAWRDFLTLLQSISGNDLRDFLSFWQYAILRQEIYPLILEQARTLFPQSPYFSLSYETHFLNYLMMTAEGMGWYFPEVRKAMDAQLIKIYIHFLNPDAEEKEEEKKKKSSVIQFFKTRCAQKRTAESFLDYLGKQLDEKALIFLNSLQDFKDEDDVFVFSSYVDFYERLDAKKNFNKNNPFDIDQMLHLAFDFDEKAFEKGNSNKKEIKENSIAIQKKEDPKKEIIGHKREASEMPEALRATLIQLGLLFEPSKIIQKGTPESLKIVWYIDPGWPEKSSVFLQNAHQDEKIDPVFFSDPDFQNKRPKGSLFPFSEKQATIWDFHYFPGSHEDLMQNLEWGVLEFPHQTFQDVQFDQINPNFWTKVDFSETNFSGANRIGLKTLVMLIQQKINLKFLPINLYPFETSSLNEAQTDHIMSSLSTIQILNLFTELFKRPFLFLFHKKIIVDFFQSRNESNSWSQEEEKILLDWFFESMAKKDGQDFNRLFDCIGSEKMLFMRDENGNHCIHQLILSPHQWAHVFLCTTIKKEIWNHLGEDYIREKNHLGQSLLQSALRNGKLFFFLSFYEKYFDMRDELTRSLHQLDEVSLKNFATCLQHANQKNEILVDLFEKMLGGDIEMDVQLMRDCRQQTNSPHFPEPQALSLIKKHQIKLINQDEWVFFNSEKIGFIFSVFLFFAIFCAVLFFVPGNFLLYFFALFSAPLLFGLPFNSAILIFCQEIFEKETHFLRQNLDRGFLFGVLAGLATHLFFLIKITLLIAASPISLLVFLSLAFFSWGLKLEWAEKLESFLEKMSVPFFLWGSHFFHENIMERAEWLPDNKDFTDLLERANLHECISSQAINLFRTDPEYKKEIDMLFQLMNTPTEPVQQDEWFKKPAIRIILRSIVDLALCFPRKIPHEDIKRELLRLMFQHVYHLSAALLNEDSFDWIGYCLALTPDKIKQIYADFESMGDRGDLREAYVRQLLAMEKENGRPKIGRTVFLRPMQHNVEHGNEAIITASSRAKNSHP